MMSVCLLWLQARTAALVNVREAHSPTDNRAAQEVTGKVEAKLVEHKVGVLGDQAVLPSAPR